MIVKGATVLVYYLIEGNQTETAVRVRERDPEWAAPELWRSELMNVLWTYVRRGDFDLDLALARFDLALDLIGPHTYAVTAAEVLPLAVTSGCTAYDSQYVALARRLSARLVTNDRPVLKAFPDVAARPEDFIRGDETGDDEAES